MNQSELAPAESLPALVHRAQHDPDTLTEHDIERLNREVVQPMIDAAARLADVLTDTFNRAFTQLTLVLNDFANALLDGQDPRRYTMTPKAYRRVRKTEQIVEHRARVAARAPQWKRPQE